MESNGSYPGGGILLLQQGVTQEGTGSCPEVWDTLKKTLLLQTR